VNFFPPIIFGVVALNGLKELIIEKRKKRKTFIKMDKSNFKDDELID